MQKNAKKSKTCSLCQTHDEEDTMLMTKALMATFANFKDWSTEGSETYQEISWDFLDSDTKLREMFRMVNFQKLIGTVLGEKHSLPKRCKHKPFEK